MRSATLILVLLATPALAQTYPFEGRWEQGGNGCNQADTFTAREIRSYADPDGVCRLTRITRINESTYGYETRCHNSTGRYASSGTIQMQGPNRFLQRDRLMQGQTTTYSRCQ